MSDERFKREIEAEAIKKAAQLFMFNSTLDKKEERVYTVDYVVSTLYEYANDLQAKEQSDE